MGLDNGNRLSNRSHDKFDKHHRRNVILIVAGVIATVLIVYIVASNAYSSSVDAKLHDGLDQNVSSSLSGSGSVTKPLYMLFLGGDDADSSSSAKTKTIILARIDPKAKQVSLISIPHDSYVDLGGTYGSRSLDTAYALGGPALTVQAVSSITGVDISHYAQVDASGFSAMVDALGGVEVNVAQRIDDSTAGDYVLQKGDQVLGGGQALVYCRSEKIFADGDVTRMSHQREVLAALLGDLEKTSGLGRLNMLDRLSSCVCTDMSSKDIRMLIDELHGIDVADDVYSSVAPSSSQVISNNTYSVIDTSALAQMMARVNNGEAPLDDSSVSSLGNNATVAAASYTVDIQNGSGVTGCASQATQRLQDASFKVGSVGNASSFNFSETLVVYSDTSKASVANAVLAAVGSGKVVASNGKYTFTGDILVIIGKDWIPD